MAFAAAVAPFPTRAEPAPADFPAVRAFADAVVASGKVPGITIAIGMGDAPTRFITAGKAGFAATDTPVTPDSLWRIYSMTKPVTAVAAMILIDRGTLRLDQSVDEIFPEFRDARVLIDPKHGLDTRPATGGITIRELMTHTSGLNYAIVIDTPARKELERLGVLPFQANPAIEAKARLTRAPTLAEFARRAGKAGLVADPGTAWNYSMGMDVLAAVVERVSGTPFDTFVQREILGPLKMRDTYWRVPGKQAGRLVSSYGPSAMTEAMWPGLTRKVNATYALVDAAQGSVYLQAPSFPYGGAGLVSSARDYDRFLHMLQDDGALEGTRILRPETARLMMSDLLPPGVVYAGSGPIPPGERFGFGAGGFVTTAAVDGYGRGRGTYGWDGAAGTRGWTDPVRHLRVTMMINVLGGGAIGGDFDKAVAQDVAAAGARP
jgi:CubicO group peptidase (beta-lactamase class C family)